jgi:flagellar basal-body rod modification protein FlgD
MATTAITSSTDLTTATTTAVNPDSELDKDDFLQLLITQLQYQDPTQPTDTEEILNQTSQLASLEAQQNTNKALEELTASFKQSKDFSAVSAIGKYAKLDTSVKLTKDTDGNPMPVNFNLNFAEDAKAGTIQIFDDKNRLVKTMEIEETESGIHPYKWDGFTDAGEKAKTGEYKIIANYINPDGVTLQADFGAYKIESVKFEDDKTYVKLNGSYIDFTKVDEIFEG